MEWTSASLGPKGPIYMVKYVFVVLMNFPYSHGRTANTSKDNLTIQSCKEKTREASCCCNKIIMVI